jgi:ABC-2 type transport system ATP-binding protein
MPLIQTIDLVKEYTVTEKSAGVRAAVTSLFRPKRKKIVAVDGINLSIERGETVAYLGPNGAGKSTTIKMLCGILFPSSGEVLVDGLSPWRDRQELAGRIGVVFGQRTQLYWDLRLGESFELLRRIYQIPAETFRANHEWLEETLGLRDIIDSPVRSLSLGQRMRGEVAAALLHNPDILFLDEPTIGLDVEAKQRIREFILELNRTRNTTVLLTTHDLDDVEKLCQRLVIINHGIVVEDGPLGQMMERLAPCRVMEVEHEEALPPLDIPGVEVAKEEGQRTWLRFSRTQISAPALIQALSARMAIRELRVHEPKIEDILKEIYQRPAAKEG